MVDLRTTLLVLLFCAFRVEHVSCYSITITPLSQAVWFIDGRPLTLTCSTDRKGSSDLAWTKNGYPLDPKEYQIESWTDGDDSNPKHHVRLTKAEANTTDIAAFGCSDGDNDDSRTTHMFSVFTRNANITEGSDTVLECNPQLVFMNTSITWYKSNVPLKEIPGLKGRIDLAQDNKTVSFRKTSVTDSGVYTCRIEMTPGTQYVQVFQENVVLNGKPYITNFNTQDGLKNVSVTSAVLKCPAEGYPIPEIYWFRGNEVLEPLEASSKIRLSSLNGLKDAQLELTELTEEDYGRYTCSAENVLGKATFTYSVNSDDGVNSNTGTTILSVSKLLLALNIVLLIASFSI